LEDRLRQTYERHRLFMDVPSIKFGQNLENEISDRIAACDVMLVVIGPDWLDARDDAGARRLDNPRDFVRFEVETALDRNVYVIPVLVDGAAIPRAQDLPAPLRRLVDHKGAPLTHDQFEADVRDLLLRLQELVPSQKQRLRPAGLALLAGAGLVLGLFLLPIWFRNRLSVFLQLGIPAASGNWLGIGFSIPWVLVAAWIARGAAGSPLRQAASATLCAIAWGEAALWALSLSGWALSGVNLIIVGTPAIAGYGLSVALLHRAFWAAPDRHLE
jgi:hypothetical protein